MADESGTPYSYWLYTPDEYDETTTFPLLVYLHGHGEVLQSSEAELDRLSWATGTIPYILYQYAVEHSTTLTWSPSKPMLVVCPQSTIGTWTTFDDHYLTWAPNDVHTFISYVAATYKVDPKRIYLTGFSRGGFGTYNYLTTMGSASLVAAAVPIAAQGHLADAGNITIPLWAFHGDADTIIPYQPDVDMVAAINAAGNTPVPAKLTVFPGVAHDCTPVYTGPGVATSVSTLTYASVTTPTMSVTSSPFADMTIYDWMLQYSKD